MANPTLSELPDPSKHTVGLPWTELGSSSEHDLEEITLPKISIVTPSYNQADFLEATIRSILLQGYPNLQYVVIDGGSTDGSLDIIRKYEPWLDYWESTSDEGAAHAINKGLSRSTGTWFNWINSDDFLLPGALITLAKVASLAPEANWISGGRLDVNINGLPGRVCIPWQEDPGVLALGNAFFPQDATFIRRSFLECQSIELDQTLSNVFDTDLYFRLLQIERPLLTSAIFSAMRRHEGQKTANVRQVKREARIHFDEISIRSPVQRIVRRMTQTRLRPVAFSLIRLLLHYGLWPDRRNWKACVYHADQRGFSIVDPTNWMNT